MQCLGILEFALARLVLIEGGEPRAAPELILDLL